MTAVCYFFFHFLSSSEIVYLPINRQDNFNNMSKTLNVEQLFSSCSCRRFNCSICVRRVFSQCGQINLRLAQMRLTHSFYLSLFRSHPARHSFITVRILSLGATNFPLPLNFTLLAIHEQKQFLFIFTKHYKSLIGWLSLVRARHDLLVVLRQYTLNRNKNDSVIH